MFPRATRPVAVLAAAAVALVACDAGGRSATSSGPSRSARSTPGPTGSTGSAGVSVPASADSPVAVPTGLPTGAARPCAAATTAAQAAAFYVGLAELGLTDRAQACVTAGVARSTTARLRADRFTGYLAGGTGSGPTFTFGSLGGARTASVHVARGSAGFVVDRVTVSGR